MIGQTWQLSLKVVNRSKILQIKYLLNYAEGEADK